MKPYRLVEPVAIGKRSAPSRIVFGPHETNFGQGRAISDRHVAYYTKRASGGVGVIVTETASVTPDDWPYERAPLAGECATGWAALAASCEPFGTLVLAGLGHAGAQGSSAYSQSVMWAPSRVADVVSREPPAELDIPSIGRLVDYFASAARTAVRSGLGGVEVDAGAFSLLRQFHSGLTNQRGDEYGQDRLKLTREILVGVRQAIGPDHVLAVRLSCDELAPWAGITPEQAADMVGHLAPDVDLLTVVRGGPYSTSAYRPDGHTGANFNRELCHQMRQAAGGEALVVLQGSVVDAEVAEAALADGVCDLVEMTRAQIADASLVRRVRTGLVTQIRPCLLCNQACRVRDNRNPILSCVMDPSAGYETSEPEPEPGPENAPPVPPGTGAAPVLVVGAGPAGLECARVLALAGRQVAVAERRDRAGGAVLAAAKGEGRSRLTVAVEWLEAECRRLGVNIQTGMNATAPEIEEARVTGWQIVLATGSRPYVGRYPDGPSPWTVDARAALEQGAGSWPTGPVVVHDPVGDAVGVSVAERMASEGRPVVFVCQDPVAGTQLSRTGDLADANVRLERAGVVRRLRSRIIGCDAEGVTIEDVWTGETSRVEAAVLVDCGHRLPDDLLYAELGDPDVMRAGDCVAPRSILEAVLEGRRVASSLAGWTPASGIGAGVGVGLEAAR